jgi:tripartite-type tricarboxylate transporter receptor subunit TctC
MTDVIAGNIPVMFSSVTQTLPHVRAGRLKLLAVGAAKRSPAVPEVPTAAEAGYPGYEVTTWWGIVVPAGVPAGIRDRLYREIAGILAQPETKKRLAADAAETWDITPAAMRKVIHNDVKRWTEVARKAGIREQ